MRVDVGVRVTGSSGGEELRCCVFPWFSEDGTWAAERTTSRLFGGSLFTTTYVTPEGIGHTVTVRRDADDVPTGVTHDNGGGAPADLAFDTLETTDAINDYHVVGIPVADFAALFDLDYRIDEEQGTVSFG